MVRQDRFRSMTVYGKLFIKLSELFTQNLSFRLPSILPLNIVNEKTYIFIWFWYLILLVMLIGLVIYRLLIIFVPSVRARVLNARNRMVPREIAVSVSNKVDIGDWWIIYMLGRNLDPIIYKDVLAELAKSISVPSKKNKTWDAWKLCSNLKLFSFWYLFFNFGFLMPRQILLYISVI